MAPTLLNNRYRSIRALGAGGFGETFLAEDTYMPSARPCVIKQLKPVTDNPQMYQIVQQRFQREAAVLEDLGEGSNQIPKLYAYFSEEGQFYLVQEWIEGVTLTKKVEAEGRQSESVVRSILASLLPVLDYVHSKQMVHRDIKPDNIILRKRDGLPVLIDFGAVKEAMGTVANTQGNPTNSIVVGTPGFMPAEQAAGKPVFSSDLYSLGLTAIYMLTGKIPQELEVDPRSGEFVWQQYAAHVNPQLVAVLDKAIKSHPRDRYSSAREMLTALQSPAAPVQSPDLSQMKTVAVAPGDYEERAKFPPRQQNPVIPNFIPNIISNIIPTLIRWNWRKIGMIGGAIAAFLLVALFLSRLKPAQESAKTQQATSVKPTPSAGNQTGNSPSTNASRPPSPPARNQTDSSPSPSATPSAPSPPGRNQTDSSPSSSPTPSAPSAASPIPSETPRAPSVASPIPSETPRSQPNSAPISVYTERVRFSPGSTGTTLSGRVETNQNRRYLINAQKGQKFTVEVLEGDLNVAAIAPGGFRLGSVNVGKSQWQGTVPKTGDYVLEISSPTGSDYEVNVSILSEDATATPERSPTQSDATKPSPYEAVRDYYAKLINNRQYEAGWSKLSRRFQKNHSRDSYLSYSDWWEQVDRVEVRQVKVVDPGDESAVVDVRLTYYMADGRVNQEAQRLWLIWDVAKRSWLIDDRSYLR